MQELTITLHNGHSQRERNKNETLSLTTVRVGTFVLIVSEIMLFAGLVSAYFVHRSQATAWPPEGLPRYPVWQTLLNTLFLLASGITNWRYRSLKKAAWGWLTLFLGITFVVLQGVEWVRLISFGLTLTVDIYGSIFYAIVGCHALHVVAGSIWYTVSLLRQSIGSPAWRPINEGASIFWYFVVGIWLPLYIVVYLT